MVTDNPEGMIPVGDFAKTKGMTTDKVVNMIRDGFYVGRKVGDDWFIDKSELKGTQKKASTQFFADDTSDIHDVQSVVITDIQMPFGSMVVFMVKWAIAFIPAAIILFLLFLIISAIFAGIISGVGTSNY